MRLALPALCLVVLGSSAVAGGSAWAGPALDDDKQKERTPSPVPEPTQSDEAVVEYGVGLRLRSVWIPKSVLELFVERAAGGAHNYGFGVDLTRRRGTTELQLGLEYEHVNVGQGVWINKGDNVAPPTNDEADFILGPDDSGHQMAWFTIEFTFLNHAKINKYASIRYGGGAGLGIVWGPLYRVQAYPDKNAPEGWQYCPGPPTTASPPIQQQYCAPDPDLGNDPQHYPGYSEPNWANGGSKPMVFPWLAFQTGLRIKPTPKFVGRVDLGIGFGQLWFGIGVDYGL